MFPEECEIGLAVDHISGCQGIIISAPQQYSNWYEEWVVLVMKQNGRSEELFIRRLRKHVKK
jgi:hypothetical protein